MNTPEFTQPPNDEISRIVDELRQPGAGSLVEEWHQPPDLIDTAALQALYPELANVDARQLNHPPEGLIPSDMARIAMTRSQNIANDEVDYPLTGKTRCINTSLVHRIEIKEKHSPTQKIFDAFPRAILTSFEGQLIIGGSPFTLDKERTAVWVGDGSLDGEGNMKYKTNETLVLLPHENNIYRLTGRSDRYGFSNEAARLLDDPEERSAAIEEATAKINKLLI